MNKKNYVLLGLFATLVLAGCGTNNQTPETTGTESGNVVIETTGEAATEATGAVILSGYTLGDVSLHSTKDNCRTAVDGKVYDITKAFGNHKGGDEALMKLCGTNGTNPFNTQHGENEKAKGTLDSLYIGDLL